MAAMSVGRKLLIVERLSIIPGITLLRGNPVNARAIDRRRSRYRARASDFHRRALHRLPLLVIVAHRPAPECRFRQRAHSRAALYLACELCGLDRRGTTANLGY